MTTRRDTLRQTVALASLGAGAIHLALGPDHMSAWVVLGTGFYASGVAQVVLGAALLRAESRRLLALATAGSLALIGVWLMSRTIGLPLGPQAFQPEASGRADVLCISLEVVAALGAFALLRFPNAGRVPAGNLAARGIMAAVASAVLATTGVAVAAPSHSHGPGHAHTDSAQHTDSAPHSHTAAEAHTPDEPEAQAPKAIAQSPTPTQSHAPGHTHEKCPPSPVESGKDTNGNGADDGVEAYFQCVLTNSHSGPHQGGYVPQDLSR